MWKLEKKNETDVLLSFFTLHPRYVFRFREILPEKHVEYFNPWVYSFGYELITHSTRLPLISGFYKLLSVTMKIAKKIKYFEVRSLFPDGGVVLYWWWYISLYMLSYSLWKITAVTQLFQMFIASYASSYEHLENKNLD